MRKTFVVNILCANGLGFCIIANYIFSRSSVIAAIKPIVLILRSQ